MGRGRQRKLHDFGAGQPGERHAWQLCGRWPDRLVQRRDRAVGHDAAGSLAQCQRRHQRWQLGLHVQRDVQRSGRRRFRRVARRQQYPGDGPRRVQPDGGPGRRRPVVGRLAADGHLPVHGARRDMGRGGQRKLHDFGAGQPGERHARQLCGRWPDRFVQCHDRRPRHDASGSLAQCQRRHQRRRRDLRVQRDLHRSGRRRFRRDARRQQYPGDGSRRLQPDGDTSRRG